MRYVRGVRPIWKGKPKASPLDNDDKFQKLVADLTKGDVPENGLTLYIDQVADGKRWGVKNAWRVVRDQVNRKIEDLGAENKYMVTCRQTEIDGEWAVWVMLRKTISD
jgi:hypothetical protein